MPRASARAPREVFAQQVERARRARGWTQQRLATELAKVGHPLDRPTVTRIEGGERNVLLDDLFAFAAAFGVSPVSLLVPYETERVAVTAKTVVSSWDLLCWLRGDTPLPGAHDDEGQAYFRDGMTRHDDAVAEKFPHLDQIRAWVVSAIYYAGDVVGAEELHELRILAGRIAEDAPLIERDVERWEQEA